MLGCKGFKTFLDLKLVSQGNVEGEGNRSAYRVIKQSFSQICLHLGKDDKNASEDCSET